MDEPNWATVLEWMHDNEISYINPDYLGKRIQDDLGLSDDEIEDSLRYLSQSEIIVMGENGFYYRLSEKGFEVAHDRKMMKHQTKQEDVRSKRQHDVNRGVAFLTLGLMTVTIIDSAVRTFVGMESYWTALSAVGMGMLLTLLFILVLYFSDILEPLSID